MALQLDPSVEVFRHSDGRIFLRNDGLHELHDVDPDALAALLRYVERRGVREVIRTANDGAAMRRFLETLAPLALSNHPQNLLRGKKKKIRRPSLRVRGAPKIILIGNGAIAASVFTAIEQQGDDIEWVRTLRTASGKSRTFLARDRKRVVFRAASARKAGASAASSLNVSGLSRRLRGRALVICALANTRFRSILDLCDAARQVQVPIMFAACDAHALSISPLFVPGAGGCFACAQLTQLLGDSVTTKGLDSLLEFFTAYDVPDTARAESVCIDAALMIAEAVRHLRDDGPPPDHLFFLRRLPFSSLQPRSEIRTHLRCIWCRNAPKKPIKQLGRSAIMARVASLYSQHGIPNHPVAPVKLPQSIGVIGGGTAGYMTALALQRAFPETKVELVESSEVPIIGVGEATTPPLVSFLHRQLGIDVVDFYSQVKPTWKLGIRFLWGRPGDYEFNYPFPATAGGGQVWVLPAVVYGGNLSLASFESLLMSAEKAPFVRTQSGLHSLMSHTAYAYHLDNRRFVSYLHRTAAARGIARIDATLTDVVLRGEDLEVERLICKDGRTLRYDLYVDCTGFKSLLIEKVGSPWLSYASSLLTDSAVMANQPHGGSLKPYTMATTMDCGWAWTIPEQESDHRGYVFCSAFSSVEQAAAELRRKSPDIGETWNLKFRSGRHEHFAKGNVVAIGNSYGFVEPLESTALYVVILEINGLISSLRDGLTRAEMNALNQRMGAAWDRLRWFLSVHYRFNRKSDSSFWKTCRNEVDYSGAEHLVSRFREAAPLDNRGDLDPVDRVLFGFQGLDFLLLGQGVETQMLAPDESRQQWETRALRPAQELVAQCVSQAEALEAIRRDPSLLDGAVNYLYDG
jgi:tryptophan 7-halogenase